MLITSLSFPNSKKHIFRNSDTFILRRKQEVNNSSDCKTERGARQITSTALESIQPPGLGSCPRRRKRRSLIDSRRGHCHDVDAGAGGRTSVRDDDGRGSRHDHGQNSNANVLHARGCQRSQSLSFLYLTERRKEGRDNGGGCECGNVWCQGR